MQVTFSLRFVKKCSDTVVIRMGFEPFCFLCFFEAFRDLGYRAGPGNVILKGSHIGSTEFVIQATTKPPEMISTLTSGISMGSKIVLRWFENSLSVLRS